LITVKITMCSRGSPKDLAILHSLSDDVYRKWVKVLNIRRSAGITPDQEIPEEVEVDTFVQEGPSNCLTFNSSQALFPLKLPSLVT